ncbi:MAG: Ig-like domain-containing protein [Gemmatimonadetes bacterium]|nr:Ig-like domain-containing protein [Gemmatimonadota bacterium]
MVTIEGVGAGSTVVTVTASDGQATAAQGFNVTVAAAPPNNPPVAVGTIPGSSLEIGGSATIDASGYFSDADGDELTYTGSSSNEGVATVAMEGANATITAVAAGDAVITITANDGSASVSQGFRVEVNTGPKEATVVISRLLDAERNQISDPTGISGTIYVVLDVESNDETWTEIGLTLGDETVTPMCRGGTSADAAVGPGLAAAGQAEIECQLNTNAVVGECVGMQLMPKYANGEYDLGAFLTTDAGDRRDVVASSPIALSNSGFVKIAHAPGSASEVGAHTAGLTFYGGPNADGNVNMFHACPVAYDGTVVGKMRLSTRHTDTARPTPAPVDAPSLSFREARGGPQFPTKEAPFTWSASTIWWSGNGGVENVPGGDNASETWIVNDGQILDPNGRDVTTTFRSDGEAKLGPLHFDFKAPAISETSEVVIATSNSPTHSSWVATSDRFYNDRVGNSSRRFRITGMTDMGVGHVYGTTSAIAVGDWSEGRNSDTNANTAFTAIEGLENVTLVSQLPEEDDSVDGVADGGGVDTYVAEVQSLADRLGNSTWLGGGRIRTATNFGVDRTGPVISRERPSEALVLSTNELHFEVEDPRLETGEDGSGLTNAVTAWAGGSSPRSNSTYWVGSATVDANGSATIDIDPGTNARFAREASHTVFAWTPDHAGNGSSTSFTFTRDRTDPVLSLSAVPSSFGSITAKSVSVTVAGTLNDATEIRRAFLSIHHGTTCTAADPLAGSQVSGPVRRLDNGTNSIEFSEVFTVKQGDDNGATNYCFFLHAEDDARDADDRSAMNSYSDVIATFGVTWPAGPPPAPTYELVFTDADDMALDMLAVNEGSMATYKVALSEAPTADVTVAISVAEANRMVYADLSADELTFTPANYGTAQEVTVTTLSHDDNAMAEMFTLSHDASDGGYDNADADLSGMVNDDEVALMASLMSLGENDDTTAVTVSVSTDVADPGAGDNSQDKTITVTLGGSATGDATNGTDFGVLAADKGTAISGTFDIVLAEGETMKDTMIYIVPTDDAAEEDDEVIPVTGSMSGGSSLTAPVVSSLVAEDEIGLMDNDPDVMISTDVTSVDEDVADPVEVMVTVTAPGRRSVDRTFTVAVATDPTARAAVVANFTITIGPGELTGTGTFNLDPTGNTDDDGDATVTVSIESVAPATKENGVNYTFGTAEIEIADNDDS